MQDMNEPELEYPKFYKVMPPGKKAKKYLSILVENDADTYHGEEKIERS